MYLKGIKYSWFNSFLNSFDMWIPLKNRMLNYSMMASRNNVFWNTLPMFFWGISFSNPFWNPQDCLSWKREQLDHLWKVVCLALMWLGTPENTTCFWYQNFGYQTNLTFAKWFVNRQAPLKLLLWLTVVRIGTNESTAFVINKSYLLNIMCQPQKAIETNVFDNSVSWN